MPHAIILDDLQCRHDAFRAKYGAKFDDIKSCYNMAELLHHLLYCPGEVRFISLDHDLGDTTTGKTLYGTGMDAVRLLDVLPDRYLPLYINVHSHNYAKAEEMMYALRRAGFSPTNEYFTEE
jgi:hypothetical protein